MIKEIGSSFYLSKNDIVKSKKMYNFPIADLKSNIEFFSSCRNSITVALEKIPSDRECVLVPPFTCGAVLQPFLAKKMQIQAYKIGEDLSIDIDFMYSLLDKPEINIVLLHSYFGFQNMHSLKKIIDYAHERNIYVIEDRTHSMFSSFEKTNSDYIVGSLRKWLPIPDGGFLATDEKIEEKKFNENSEKISLALDAFNKKYNYLFYGEGDDISYRNLFSLYEEQFDKTETVYAISDITKGLCNMYNWEQMCDKRRDNFKILSENINWNDEIKAIFNYLPDMVIPFMFPIYVKWHNRKQLQKYLANNKIFATAIWKCPKELESEICSNERKIYEEILCIPCDQRYNIEDMMKICNLINVFIKRGVS